MQIAIADNTGNVTLWCDVNSVNEDGSIDFEVINGGWRGRYENGRVYVEYTKATIPGFLVWTGSKKEAEYNIVIENIQNEINDPEYQMTPLLPAKYYYNEANIEDWQELWDEDPR